MYSHGFGLLQFVRGSHAPRPKAPSSLLNELSADRAATASRGSLIASCPIGRTPMRFSALDADLATTRRSRGSPPEQLRRQHAVRAAEGFLKVVAIVEPREQADESVALPIDGCEQGRGDRDLL